MEKNGSWTSEYGYFITVKCPLCGTDGSKKTEGRVSLEGGVLSLQSPTGEGESDSC